MLVALAACTTSVADVSGAWPIERYSIAAVGEVVGDDPAAQDFRRALVDGLEESAAFVAIADPAPSPLPEAAFLVIAEVRRYTECGGFLPIVSCSSRRAYLGAHVTLQDSAGQPLGSFTVRRRLFLFDATGTVADAAVDTIVARARGGT
jgi:hypothetical protein